MGISIVRASLIFVVVLFVLSGCKQDVTVTPNESLSTESPQIEHAPDLRRLLSMDREQLIADLGHDYETQLTAIPQADMQFQSVQFHQSGLNFLFYDDKNKLPFGVKLNPDHNPLNIAVDGVEPGMEFEEVRKRYANVQVRELQLEDRPVKTMTFHQAGLVYVYLFEDSAGRSKELYIYLDKPASDKDRKLANHWVAWELLADRLSISEVDQRGFYFMGTDTAGGYQFQFVAEQHNGAGYVVDPGTGNVYDPVSESTISNLFDHGLILDGYDAAAIAREGGWLDAQFNVFPSHSYGWIVLDSVDANGKRVKSLLVDPVSGEVADFETRQSLGNLKQWKAEHNQPVIITYEVDQLNDSIQFSYNRVVLVPGGQLVLRPADPEFQLLASPDLADIVDWEVDLNSDDLLLTGVKAGTARLAFKVAHMASVRGTLEVTVLE